MCFENCIICQNNITNKNAFPQVIPHIYKRTEFVSYKPHFSTNGKSDKMQTIEYQYLKEQIRTTNFNKYQLPPI